MVAQTAGMFNIRTIVHILNSDSRSSPAEESSGFTTDCFRLCGPKKGHQAHEARRFVPSVRRGGILPGIDEATAEDWWSPYIALGIMHESNKS